MVDLGLVVPLEVLDLDLVVEHELVRHRVKVRICYLHTRFCIFQIFSLIKRRSRLFSSTAKFYSLMVISTVN